MFRALKLLAGVALSASLCLPMIATPASAGATTVATSTMTADFAAAMKSGTLILLPPDASVESEGKKGGKWRGGAIYNADTRKWMATASNRDSNMAWGSYDTKEEAQAEGSAQAEYNNRNGVMAGPGCNPPFVLC